MNTWMQLMPFVGTLLFLTILAGIYRYATGSWNVLRLAMGADGLYSTSKMQWLLWTIAALVAYVAILFAVLIRKWPNQGESIGIPGNLIAAMGISLFGAVAAKAITQQQINRGLIQKREAPPQTASRGGPPTSLRRDGSYPSGMSALFNNDDNQPDLVKAQLMMWTLVALLVYLMHTASAVLDILNTALIDSAGKDIILSPFLPDIDSVLLALTGLGQGGYLATKLVSTSAPRLTNLLGEVTPGGEVVLHGVGLENRPAGSQVIVWADGQRQVLTLLSQSPHSTPGERRGAPLQALGDKRLRFRLPALQPGGSPWRPGQTVEIGLEMAGKPIDTILSATVQLPTLQTVEPSRALPGEKIRLTGAHFGPYAPGHRILLGNYPVEVQEDKWSPTQIEVAIPVPGPNNSWRPLPGEEITLGIQRHGEPVRWEKPTLRLDYPPILFPPDESSYVSPGSLVVLHGSGFGAQPKEAYLRISNEEFRASNLADLEWDNETIQFRFPDDLSARLNRSVEFPIVVRVHGKLSEAEKFQFRKAGAS